MKQKIGWQKYEDIVEQNLHSPVMDMIAKMITESAKKSMPENDDEYYEEEEVAENHSSGMIPLSPQLLEDISMLSNFDCWMAHTNFDITPKIKEQLDSIEGVELLKVCSRYRFFIGVGKMFDFKDVRKKIESKIT